jgi:AAA family ATP:ADP antiporter
MYRSSGREQHGWLANVEFWRQTVVLALQLFCTGRLLQRWPGAVLLVSLPIVSIFGLGALWLAPALLTINLVQVVRGGAQYAFEKPAREVLYTPLSLATKHKVKFLLDTFAFRLGDLCGAVLVVGLGAAQVSVAGILAITVVVALAWIALGLVLGRRSAEPRAEGAAAPDETRETQRASTS